MATTNYKLFTKILAITMFTFLVSGAVWIFKNDNDKIVTKQNFELEKSTILKKLNRIQDSIGILINQNSAYKSELAEQNLKIADLINKVGKSTSGTVIKEDYSKEMQGLQNEIVNLKSINANLLKLNETYVKEINVLKSDVKVPTIVAVTPEKTVDIKKLKLDSNESIRGQRLGLITSVSKTNAKKDSLAIAKSNVKFEDNIANKIAVSNLKTASFVVNKSGLMLATDKVNKANVVKISFDVSGNKSINFLYKEYYIQIIDSKNNVIGLRKTKKFGSNELVYSGFYQMTFRNEPQTVSVNIDLLNEEKGIFYVKIFDQGKIMDATTFTLK